VDTAAQAASGGAGAAACAQICYADTAGTPATRASAAEAVVFYYKLAADYCRYAAECLCDATTNAAAVRGAAAAPAPAPQSSAGTDFAASATVAAFSDQALAYYSKARAYSALYLHPAAPAVLGVTLNFTVFLFEIRRCESEAYDIAAAALEEAAAALAADDEAAAAAETRATAAIAGAHTTTAAAATATAAGRARGASSASSGASSGGSGGCGRGSRYNRSNDSTSNTSSSRCPPLTAPERADSGVVQQLIRENLHVWGQVLKVTALLV
jgi:hypothetical protein